MHIFPFCIMLYNCNTLFNICKLLMYMYIISHFNSLLKVCTAIFFNNEAQSDQTDKESKKSTFCTLHWNYWWQNMKIKYFVSLFCKLNKEAKMRKFLLKRILCRNVTKILRQKLWNMWPCKLFIWMFFVFERTSAWGK